MKRSCAKAMWRCWSGEADEEDVDDAWFDVQVPHIQYAACLCASLMQYAACIWAVSAATLQATRRILCNHLFDRCGRQLMTQEQQLQREGCEARTESSPMASSSADFCTALRLE